jgi:uncharacterized caspase-like protein
MANDAGQDLAVVMFSGHGTMIDGQFYLVPYGADDSTPARLKSSGIAASAFQSEVLKLAGYGRVLVLFDACRSAGLIGGNTNALSAADALKSALAANNVTVLTSSAADRPSREDDRWQHGAFTKVMLDALSSSADDIDTDRDGRLHREAPAGADPRRSATRARPAFRGRHLCCRIVIQRFRNAHGREAKAPALRSWRECRKIVLSKASSTIAASRPSRQGAM